MDKANFDELCNKKSSNNKLFEDEIIVQGNSLNRKDVSNSNILQSTDVIITEKTNIKSGKLQDIMGEIPHWTQRVGIIIISVIFSLIIVACFIIKSPDIITAEIVLTTEIPTENVVSKVNGKISQLYVKNNSPVKAGDCLGIIENTADFNDVQYLKGIIEKIIVAPDTVIYIYIPNMKLGNFQSQYSDFNKLAKDIRSFNEVSYYPQKIEYIKERISQFKVKKKNIENEIEIIRSQHKLAMSSFSRDSLLFVKNSLSLQEYENSKKELLQNELNLHNTKSTLINILSDENQLDESLLDIEKQYLDRKNELYNNLISSATNILNEIKTWEMNFVLKSSVNGEVTFTKFWSENQNVTSGETVFFIAPTKTQRLIIKGTIPVEKSGKVSLGQSVNVIFSNFPYQEFGMVKGKIISKSLVPSDGKYSIDIELINGLKTTYNKELPYSQDMKGTAEIITENVRLAEKLFSPIKFILSKSID